MQRMWEIDVLRGTAVMLMVLFHLVFDLAYLGLWSVNPYAGGFLLLQRTTAFLFLSLVGVSLALSHQKHPGFGHNLSRFFALAAVALLITLATSIYPGNGAIVFGIIHLIAVSVVLGWFFLKLPATANLLLGLLALGQGMAFDATAFVSGFAASAPAAAQPFFLVLGFPHAGFASLDYYPLLPWFGLVLIGMAAGKALYYQPKPVFKTAMPSALKPLAWLGKNALAIYLVHQPILFGLIWAATALPNL
ncbi:MAG: heparan-alpha-glucosaminide N-acetyltransferase [Candidatus Micrarchaeota archaeon]|nr:heparan-alpha-glucosaminide N-acetyltransferase [Candidatus Micrarchaeota archaeon]